MKNEEIEVARKEAEQLFRNKTGLNSSLIININDFKPISLDLLTQIIDKYIIDNKEPVHKEFKSILELDNNTRLKYKRYKKIFCYIAYRHLDYTHEEISFYMGNKNHATSYYAVKEMEYQIMENPRDGAVNIYNHVILKLHKYILQNEEIVRNLTKTRVKSK